MCHTPDIRVWETVEGEYRTPAGPRPTRSTLTLVANAERSFMGTELAGCTR